MHILRKPVIGRAQIGMSRSHAQPLQGGMPAPDFYTGNREPDLAELISDPLVLKVMASDGVGPEELRGILKAIL